MKKPTFPLRASKEGVSVTIGLVEKNGQKIFRVLYREQGKRKQAWRNTFKAAKQAADDAIEAVLTGDASALKLNTSNRHVRGVG
jgi:hemoglobin-like flavoprotein